jgi:CO dehydrogenase maturation factor
MTYTIAVSGKGGTGKTTFTSLLIHHLTQVSKEPVLAVDADPNANLNQVLGITFDKCIADIREQTLRQIPEYRSMPKNRLIEYLLHQTLVESNKIDFLVMGRPEGQRCYCFVNNLLRKHLDVISNRYNYVIIDNEAGMEHLSRMTTKNVDILFIISDPTKRGLRTATRIRELIEELEIPVEKQLLVVNRVREGKEAEVEKRAKEFGFTNIWLLPEDDTIPNYDDEGIPLTSLPQDNPVKQRMFNYASSICNGKM